MQVADASLTTAKRERQARYLYKFEAMARGSIKGIMKHKIATLLTDFGTEDYFVGAMKGALLAVAPDAAIVDLTHDIPPHDIRAGAWTLANIYPYFPSGTVHIAVVDPGVGSARSAMAMRAREQFFVGPDNGLFSFVYEREPEIEAVKLTNRNYYREPVSRTFHGRDIFAPIAGAILNGVELSELGEHFEDYVHLLRPNVRRAPDGTLEARIIHVDHFGNLITNITRDYFSQKDDERMSLEIRGRRITFVREFFMAGAEEELFAVWGSAGHLEIVARCSPAAKILNAGRDELVIIRMST